jgi:hypothetical protein
MKSWLAVFSVNEFIALVLAFTSGSDVVATTGDDWLTLCGMALEVTVVGATELSVVGVGLLFIKLSTRAEVTLG